MKKRGQVTLFIIIGIALLLAAALIFYIRSSIIQPSLTPELVPALSQIPAEAQPIRAYTEECISKVSEEAFRKIGFSGGYIAPDSFGISALPAAPTESDAVGYPGSELKVPYWWYLKSDNKCAGNCIFSSLKPPLYRSSGGAADRSVEAQVDDYVDAHLNDCLEDFAPFKDQGYSIEKKGEVKTTTSVGDYSVGVYVNYPLTIKKGDVVYSTDLFYITLPLNFKKIYNFATEISNAEINNTFLERHALNLVSAFSALNENSLPPVTESTFNFGAGRVWAAEKVKDDVQNMLMAYVPGLQVFNTANYERRFFPESDIRQSLYDQMVIPLNTDGSYSDLAARFDYLGWWPIYFDAGHGGLIQAESVLSSFIMLGWQRYSTAYDISFPSIVTITDQNAFNGNGYTFMFGLEGNLRNNEPIDRSFQGFEGAYEFQPSLLCNLNQRNSGEVSVYVKDAQTGKGLGDVQVTFTCGAESCFIGSTGQNGTMKERFPICSNGIASFLKQDYFGAAHYLTTSLDERASIPQAVLYPYAEKRIEVMKFRYSPQNKALSGNAVDLDPKEEAFVQFTRVKDSPGEIDVSAAAYFSGSAETNAAVRLVPGVYSVDVKLFLHKPVIVPEERRSTEAGFIGSLAGAPEEYIVPEVKFDDNYPSGGVLLNERAGYFVVSEDDLYSDSRIRLYAISPPLPSKVEDIDMMNNNEQYSSQFRQSVEPEFVQ